jgi:hypothetical protein
VTLDSQRSVLGFVLAAGLLVLACGAHVPPSGATSPSGEPSPDATAAPPGAELPADIAEAIAMRKEFGLRSDEAWVRAVAANPAAVMDYGVPLLPFERDDLMNRANGEDAIIGAIQAYAAEHADVFGGLYIDQANGGVVTILVTDDPKTHEDALAGLIGPEAVVAVRQVRWTEAELRDIQDRVSADQAFLDSLPARMTTSSVDIIGNVAELTISSAVPDAAERIVAHFGAEGRLRVISDGTGILLQPQGRILGHIVAPAGTDMTMLSPQYEADVDIGPRDAVGIPVAPDGTFVIDRLPPATYTVTILEVADVGNTEVGSARVVLPPGAAVLVEIPLRRP